MNQYVMFKLYKETIAISKITKEDNFQDLNNTNIIDVKDLKFSLDYIKENAELVSSFLNVVILKKNITTVQINNLDIALPIMDLVNNWEHIKTIKFKENKIIPLEIVLKLIDNKYIENVDCYEMVDYLLERLDINKNLTVKTRHKCEYVSYFMKENFINNYSDMYYKKNIIFSYDLNETEIDDVKAFIYASSKLRNIKIYKYSNELLTTLLEELNKYHKENITIEIYEQNNDLNMIIKSITYLKKKYRKYFEENNINIKIKYSKEYKKKNAIKEVNLKLLGAIIIVIIIIFILIFLIKNIKEFNDETSINNQLLEIQDILDDNQKYYNIDNNESDIDYIDNSDEITTTRPIYMKAYYTDYEQVFNELEKKNSDTVAWLTVENTKVNYPVVQTTTNSYYLEHAFDKIHNTMGWIFMDYRNNATDLDQNTIIYGHNVQSGLMFGTLKYTLNESWYTVPSNQIITFNTKTKNMKWQIFSIYRIDTTDDYLKNNFSSDEAYQQFIDLIKGRSIYDFNVEVTPNDKILTLSTCYTNTTRTVIHAKLIEDDTSQDIPE